jgi:hypothetical protein
MSTSTDLAAAPTLRAPASLSELGAELEGEHLSECGFEDESRSSSDRTGVCDLDLHSVVLPYTGVIRYGRTKTLFCVMLGIVLCSALLTATALLVVYRVTLVDYEPGEWTQVPDEILNRCGSEVECYGDTALDLTDSQWEKMCNNDNCHYKVRGGDT